MCSGTNGSLGMKSSNHLVKILSRIEYSLCRVASIDMLLLSVRTCFKSDWQSESHKCVLAVHRLRQHAVPRPCLG
jgi:hypothetical protein